MGDGFTGGRQSHKFSAFNTVLNMQITSGSSVPIFKRPLFVLPENIIIIWMRHIENEIIKINIRHKKHFVIILGTFCHAIAACTVQLKAKFLTTWPIQRNSIEATHLSDGLTLHLCRNFDLISLPMFRNCINLEMKIFSHSRRPRAWKARYGVFLVW